MTDTKVRRYMANAWSDQTSGNWVRYPDHLAALAKAEADNKRLREALERAADTFHDLAVVLQLLRHETSALSCDIAENGCRAALAAPADKERA